MGACVRSDLAAECDLAGDCGVLTDEREADGCRIFRVHVRDEEAAEAGSGKIVSGLMDMVLAERAKAKAAKDWAASDAIRDALKALGITVKDTKDGVEWTIE